MPFSLHWVALYGFETVSHSFDDIYKFPASNWFIDAPYFVELTTQKILPPGGTNCGPHKPVVLTPLIEIVKLGPNIG
jgi:hypothetical protein